MMLAIKNILLLLSISLTCTYCYGQENTARFRINDEKELQLTSTIDFSRYKGFFVGEFHDMVVCTEIKLAMIKYLNTEYGIKDIFMEIGYSTAWLYNRYLEIGDTTLFTTPNLVYAMTQPNRDFWTNLYNYNKIAANKIVIHGMDFERGDFTKALKLLMPLNKEKPIEISKMLKYIDTVTVNDVNDDLRKPDAISNTRYQMVRRDILRKKKYYRDFYGVNFQVVEKIMTNENTFNRFPERNKTMYYNMRRELEEQKISKFVTFNGLEHGNMSNDGRQSLCYRLTQNKKFKGKIAGVAVVCKYLYDQQGHVNRLTSRYRAPYTYAADSLLLKRIFDTQFNTGCKYTLIPASSANSIAAEAFSNYIILIEDQTQR